MFPVVVVSLLRSDIGNISLVDWLHQNKGSAKSTQLYIFTCPIHPAAEDKCWEPSPEKMSI